MPVAKRSVANPAIVTYVIQDSVGAIQGVSSRSPEQAVQ